MSSWSIGTENEWIEVIILSQEKEPNTRINCLINIKVGEIDGQFKSSLLHKDIKLFRDQLHKMFWTLKGTATFNTLEKQIHLDLEMDFRGHILLEGKVSDAVITCNERKFKIDFDQTFLFSTISELDEVIENL